MGEIDGGTPFIVGSSFWGTAAATGELELFFWDSDRGITNNSGTVTASAVVPEPTTFALMGLGLGLIGLSRRRKI